MKVEWKTNDMLRGYNTVFLTDETKVVCGFDAEIFSNTHIPEPIVFRDSILDDTIADNVLTKNEAANFMASIPRLVDSADMSRTTGRYAKGIPSSKSLVIRI